MWIVVLVEPYYPSVFHFDNEVEARKLYDKYKSNWGKVAHIAEVKESHFNHELYEFDKNNLETLDVEWYVYR